MRRLTATATATTTTVVATSTHVTATSTHDQRRAVSQVFPSGSVDAQRGDWKRFWGGVGTHIRRPSVFADTPPGAPKLRKTHIEWRFHHGTGGRIGRYDATRYIADFEHADGTPAPTTRARHALMHFQDKQIFDLVTAAAVVENLAQTNRLPRVPGVKEQRDWDPLMPLFLDDVDEHGAAPSLLSSSSPSSPSDGEEGNMSEALRKQLRKSAGIIASTDGSRSDDPYRRYIDAKYETDAVAANGKTIIKDAATEGEQLEPITLFASYSPAGMFTERRVMREKRVSPFDRRRWNMTDRFVVYKGPKAKNTIPDGQVKSA